MRYLPLLALASLAGCAQPVKVYRYSWGGIITAPQAAVDDFCKRPGGKWDDGTLIMRGQEFGGCALPNDHVIVVPNTCAGAEALPHELAHLDGKKDPDREGYDW